MVFLSIRRLAPTSSCIRTCAERTPSPVSADLLWMWRSVEACHIVQESEEKVHQPFCALPEVLADLHELQQATPCRTSGMG